MDRGGEKMKIFRGMAGGSGSFGSLDPSMLCPACRDVFKACFKKDEKGKVELDFSHQPKLCGSCRRKMEDQFHSGRYPDRG